MGYDTCSILEKAVEQTLEDDQDFERLCQAIWSRQYKSHPLAETLHRRGFAPKMSMRDYESFKSTAKDRLIELLGI